MMAVVVPNDELFRDVLPHWEFLSTRTPATDIYDALYFTTTAKGIDKQAPNIDSTAMIAEILLVLAGHSSSLFPTDHTVHPAFSPLLHPGKPDSYPTIRVLMTL